MNREELLEQVEDLSALLTSIDRLVPGRVDPELFAFLNRLPDCPVTADLLLAALRPLAEPEKPVKFSRRT